MIISEEKYQEILNDGLILDHYYTLCNIKNGVKHLNNKRIQGFINLLTKKEYMKDEELTEKGLLLVENCELIGLVPTEDKKNNTIEFNTWITAVHLLLQQKLKELTGGTQVRAIINKKPYSFLPNPTDLEKVLKRAMSAYKLKDMGKIESVLLKHIESCNASKHWFPLMQYYIMKDGMSPMVTDMDNVTEDKTEFKSTQKFV